MSALPSADQREVLMEAQNQEIGPIDIVVIGYPADAPMTGEAIPIMLDLVDRGIIRVLDVLFVMQGEDGAFFGAKVEDIAPEGLGDFKVFEGASSGLLGDEDVATAAEALEPGTAAVMIIYENTWAGPFVAAVRRNGGIVLDNQRISAQDLLDALDAVEATA
jgi:hypothetical protein